MSINELQYLIEQHNKLCDMVRNHNDLFAEILEQVLNLTDAILELDEKINLLEARINNAGIK